MQDGERRALLLVLLLLLFFITVDLLVLFCFVSHLGPPGNNGTILEQLSDQKCELYPELKRRQRAEQNVQTVCEGQLKIGKKQFHTWLSCFVNTYPVTETEMCRCVFFNALAKAAVFQPAFGRKPKRCSLFSPMHLL